MKHLLLSIIAISVMLSSCKTLGELGIKPTSQETIVALKNILDSSTFNAMKKMNDINSSGIESALPSEIAAVINSLKTLGYEDEVEQITKTIGQASTLVLSESEEIVRDAISELKFTDAVAVVLGGEDAATNVLKRSMYSTVKNRYSARLSQELDKTKVSTYWPIAVGAYNIFAKNKMESSLPDFLAERAVDGLFLAIGKEEAKARTDYKAIGNNVVTKVFDYYSKNKS